MQRPTVVEPQPGRCFYTPTGRASSAAGYRTARIASNEGRSPTAASGTYHVDYDRLRLVDQSREFLRDNSIYKGMIDRAVSYIVGSGFGLQARTDNPEANKAIEAAWRQWWRRPEIKGLLSGSRVERMVCREVLACGDTGIIKAQGGQIQLIEAEQISKGRTRDPGIDVDSVGRPTKFWVSPYASTGRVDTGKAVGYSPEEFLFVADPDRPSSLRAVPPCQSAFAMLHRINDVCDAEALAWQLLARLAVSVTRNGGPERAYLESTAEDTRTDTTGSLTERISEADYAIMFHGEPGEEIKGIDRNIPGQNFPNSIVMFLRLLGLPLGLPLEVVFLDWTKSNYSQSRAVLEQAYQTFLGWQELLRDFFYEPVLDWKLKQWAAQKLIPPLPAYPREWILPTFPWLDQLKEAQAYGAQVDRGFTTHANVCKALGREREDVVAARVAEITDAINKAKEIEAATGVAVPWQSFAGMEAKQPAPQPPQATEPQPEPETDEQPPMEDDDGR